MKTLLKPIGISTLVVFAALASGTAMADRDGHDYARRDAHGHDRGDAHRFDRGDAHRFHRGDGHRFDRGDGRRFDRGDAHRFDRGDDHRDYRGYGHDHDRGDHGHVRFGITLGMPLFAPDYYAPYGNPYPAYAYPPVVVQPAPPAYIERSQSQAAPAQAYWYYCAASKRYYPYVSACPAGWQRVPAQAQR